MKKQFLLLASFILHFSLVNAQTALKPSINQKSDALKDQVIAWRRFS